MRRTRGFTLVEILIVVVLLGVLAAIVIPSFANSATSAKAGSMATNLNMLRRFVLVYTSHHLEVAPGYTAGSGSALDADVFANQALLASNLQGETAARGTAGYGYGPYLSKIPTNPFNGLATIQMLGDGDDFPAEADNSHGWVYKAATGEIRPGNSGTDDSGTAYYDY
ncbi:MAG: prepilin-type N-terminal cleavage/methylation domain-containing protein [Sedimentisphaerales bacterium]|jgi:general secretion pathway protein G|nr:prepilin-type N-terminal cleavage/methylation domain-containing protein [Sedimentisphaerales bacterium]